MNDYMWGALVAALSFAIGFTVSTALTLIDQWIKDRRH